jgi:succinate dehydrogenase/fumarate reductase flavoprotein subunit
MLTTLYTIARGAVIREESRGAHYRRDFPATDSARWLRNTIIRQSGETIELTTSPVRITTLPAEGGD